jgi:hypothetical protein
MKVNKDIIKALGPCEDGYKNYLKHYSEFNSSFEDFLDLELIPYDDKVWLAKMMLTKNQLVHWSIMCAESVLPNFEKVFPEDTRMRICIESLKAIENFDNMTEEQRSAARSAAESAESAAWSAWSARSAARSAESAESAESAARSAARSAEKQQDFLNLQFLKTAASL